jgi:predicted NodU family carbamoyl transferase
MTEERTGLPVLINTSPNRGGNPILNNLSGALDILADTEVAAVALADALTVIS